MPLRLRRFPDAGERTRPLTQAVPTPCQRAAQELTAVDFILSFVAFPVNLYFVHPIDKFRKQICLRTAPSVRRFGKNIGRAAFVGFADVSDECRAGVLVAEWIFWVGRHAGQIEDLPFAVLHAEEVRAALGRRLFGVWVERGRVDPCPAVVDAEEIHLEDGLVQAVRAKRVEDRLPFGTVGSRRVCFAGGLSGDPDRAIGRENKRESQAGKCVSCAGCCLQNVFGRTNR